MSETMIGEVFVNLVSADLYIVIAAVFGICFALKKAKFFDDRFIPLAAVFLGVIIEVAYAVMGDANIIESICKGVIAGIASVYVANIIKQVGTTNNK